MGKLQRKAAVIVGSTTGIGSLWPSSRRGGDLITGRRQKELWEAAKAIGDNATGVQGDVSKLADIDRLYETVNAEGECHR
jgi:NAD(P)-dependent dehydrogenase (short-subunit alcohol dehydrogenase family)